MLIYLMIFNSFIYDASKVYSCKYVIDHIIPNNKLNKGTNLNVTLCKLDVILDTAYITLLTLQKRHCTDNEIKSIFFYFMCM